MMEPTLLQQLPKMDVLLAHPTLAASPLPYCALRDAARALLEALRQQLLGGSLAQLPPLDDLASQVSDAAQRRALPHLRPVVNATGVVLHTNLGRAPLGDAAAHAVYSAARGYSNLEYNLDSGTRGSRFSHVEALLCKLTGAEAAMVVNNNAAAVLLMLSALAAGKGVALSRGELVEIGGSFRVPEIMEKSGATLLEVGTTNKTRSGDYRRAILDQGAEVLLKVHTSNFRIVGFTQETSLAALVALGQEYALPVLYDLGSGALFRSETLGLPPGPSVEESVAAGADVVCFSGDKLLGGPQAGLIVGKRRFIAAMGRDPLARAVRIDKLTLAALEATLRLYQSPATAAAEIPTLAMLQAAPEVLSAKAHALAERLAACCPNGVFTVEPDFGEVGGGSLPGVPLPTWVVRLVPQGATVDGVEAALRHWCVPVIARIHRGALVLDVRTLSPEDMDIVVAALAAVL